MRQIGRVAALLEFCFEGYDLRRVREDTAKESGRTISR